MGRSSLDRIADLFDARRVGPGRYRSRCPAHQDHNPSLDITAGRDGRVLILCRAGCDTINVLRAVGLCWNHLFGDAPPLTPEQRTALARSRDARIAARRQLHRLHGEGCDRLLAMQALDR